MPLSRVIISDVEKNLNALVVDDELQVRNFVAEILRTYGWNVSEVSTADEAFETLDKTKWLLVFCDVKLDDSDGYEVMHRFVEKQPEVRFVLMTGLESPVERDDVNTHGIYDYLTKPFVIDDIVNIARVVSEQHRNRQTFGKSKLPFASLDYVSDLQLIGKSPKFVECLKMVGRIAATNLPVVITGESGTGKELIARAIHQRSNRAAKAFVAVNCGAIPTDLIDSELFGHVRGAFTGAERTHTGLWEEADGGTLFLDEITETNPLFQVKLLRALQQKEIRRVGSNQSKKVDVRVITATNRDIEEEVKEGRFRGDLMYRLNTVIIHLPPLNERLEDIALLAKHFARQVNLPDTPPIKFSARALELLKNYNWRGNVRELENAVIHGASLCEGTIFPEHLPERIQNFAEESIQTEDLTAVDSQVEWSTLMEMKAKHVAKVLAHTKGNKQAAINILKIDRKTLDSFIKRNQAKS